jgi:hypothetical protein
MCCSKIHSLTNSVMKLIDLTITLLNGHKYKPKQVLFYMASKRHHISQVAAFRATKCKGIWEIRREHLSLSYKAESTVVAKTISTALALQQEQTLRKPYVRNKLNLRKLDNIWYI